MMIMMMRKASKHVCIYASIRWTCIFYRRTLAKPCLPATTGTTSATYPRGDAEASELPSDQV